MSDKKMVIFNCPAYKGLTRDIPDWLDNTNCGYYTGQVPCQDCTDCKLKQIVELCKEESSIIQHKQKIKVKGLNKLADRIFELLDIQEVE